MREPLAVATAAATAARLFLGAVNFCVECSLLELSDGGLPFLGGNSPLNLLSVASHLGDGGTLARSLGRDVGLELHLKRDRVRGEVLDDNVVFKSVFTHGHIDTVLHARNGIGVLEDHAIEGNLLGPLLRNELTAKGLSIDKVGGASLAINALDAIGVFPRDAGGSLGVNDGLAAILVLENVLLKVGTGFLEGSVEHGLEVSSGGSALATFNHVEGAHCHAAHGGAGEGRHAGQSCDME